MAKKVARPGVGSAKIERELLRKARLVCIHSGVTLQDYLDRILRPVVARDYVTEFGRSKPSDK